jgi:hypothetical protein
LPVEEQVQRLLDRDVEAVLGWEKATLEMDEVFLESFADIGDAKDSKTELVTRRAVFEERMRREMEKRDGETEGRETKDRETKEMDAFERMVMATDSGGNGA